MTRRLRARAIVILVILAALAVLIPARLAAAAPARTPRSCKIALRDAQKAITIGAHTITILGDVIQMMPDALNAAASGDGDALSTLTDRVHEKTLSVQSDTAKINALKGEFQSNRDACLSG